jgi:hypothetical protein
MASMAFTPSRGHAQSLYAGPSRLPTPPRSVRCLSRSNVSTLSAATNPTAQMAKTSRNRIAPCHMATDPTQRDAVDAGPL